MAINNIGDSQTFTYTAGIQSFSVTTKGLYKLEVWGGQGGKGSNSNTSIGGYGGYSVGYKVLDIGDILYVVCGGGLNSRYNGGGASTSGTIYCGHGAGATHIAAITGTLVDIGENNLDKILIVAGGGGGGGETTSRAGGGGGGLVGSNGKSGNMQEEMDNVSREREPLRIKRKC